MPPLRILLHVQHLVGIGHLQRAALIAAALAARGHRVRLLRGGAAPAPATPPSAAYTTIQLPPASSDSRFQTLLNDRRQPVDDAWKRQRRAQVLDEFHRYAPQVLITETYPFGRGLLRFELAPLIEAAHAQQPKPLLAASLRDIPEPRPPEKARRMLQQAARYDAILVHGCADILRAEDAFPALADIRSKLHYTGYVRPPPPAAAPDHRRQDAAGRNEIVVSVGHGGMGGMALIQTCLACAAHENFTALGVRGWRILVGRHLDDAQFNALKQHAPERVTVERVRSDFRQLLMLCALSISRAGYNTMLDLAATNARAILIPYQGDGQREQTLRAQLIAKRGLAWRLADDGDAAALANAIRRALRRPKPHWPPLGDGATGAAIVLETLAKSAR